VSRWCVSVVFAWASAFFPVAASAQATGAITGLVTDASGAAVPGVTVAATSLGTAQVRTAVTGADRFYTLPLLPPAVYRLTAPLAGFRTSVRDGFEVVVNATVRADFSLQVGDVEERVTVAAAATLVETRNAALGIIVDERKIVDLPLNGRNFTQL